MNTLPCLDCDAKCEAKDWLLLAYNLAQIGIKISKINLPCPKNKGKFIIKI